MTDNPIASLVRMAAITKRFGAVTAMLSREEATAERVLEAAMGSPAPSSSQ